MLAGPVEAAQVGRRARAGTGAGTCWGPGSARITLRNVHLPLLRSGQGTGYRDRAAEDLTLPSKPEPCRSLVSIIGEHGPTLYTHPCAHTSGSHVCWNICGDRLSYESPPTS